MLFMYGEEDTTGKKRGHRLRKVPQKGRKEPLHRRLRAQGQQADRRWAAAKIAGHREGDRPRGRRHGRGKANEWTEREFKKTDYYWSIPSSGVNTIIQLKPVGETNLNYDTYDKFVP